MIDVPSIFKWYKKFFHFGNFFFFVTFLDKALAGGAFSYYKI
jgi:hypothetical protein